MRRMGESKGGLMHAEPFGRCGNQPSGPVAALRPGRRVRGDPPPQAIVGLLDVVEVDTVVVARGEQQDHTRDHADAHHVVGGRHAVSGRVDKRGGDE